VSDSEHRLRVNYENEVIPRLEAEVARLLPIEQECITLRQWKSRTLLVVRELDRLVSLLDPALTAELNAALVRI